jgi:hypothetical protein
MEDAPSPQAGPPQVRALGCATCHHLICRTAETAGTAREPFLTSETARGQRGQPGQRFGIPARFPKGFGASWVAWVGSQMRWCGWLFNVF